MIKNVIANKRLRQPSGKTVVLTVSLLVVFNPPFPLLILFSLTLSTNNKKKNQKVSRAFSWPPSLLSGHPAKAVAEGWTKKNRFTPFPSFPVGFGEGPAPIKCPVAQRQDATQWARIIYYSQYYDSSIFFYGWC